ncbi:carbohydrate esterase family 16 protein [Exidia glandulosa HHB12029]|uniref:Carbohydrate esterase family 16 protein n=1 Tax=Exidia glandulosa HHB12029 TaxID=1314781 RepID=A0A165QFV1_EXIGL|nr:carbohydrate esterase family 16 protein [Exidia glandulosa HHB12029]
MFSLASSLLLLLPLPLTLAVNLGPTKPIRTRFKNLVTFGDSYTDVVITGDCGVSWPTYAAGYANLKLFPFARAGGTCSNNLTFRPFPSVMETQVPNFVGGTKNRSIPRLNPAETLYTLWIGTNDVGASALLSGDGKPGVSVVDTTACAVNWVKVMYEHGARNFLFQNMIPLELTPIYSAAGYPNRYWAFERNATEWSVFMTELTKSGNALSKLMLQDLAPRLPGAHIGLFDSHGLFTDMHAHPARYLNGTAPLNVTGSISACVFQIQGTLDTAACTTATGTDVDSFLWFDELHPSEQADRMVAKAVVEAMAGSRKWTMWLS